MTRFRKFTRDNGDLVECEYSMQGGSEASGLCGLPEDYDPGEGAEISVVDCWLVANENDPNAPKVELTDAEHERFEQETNEDPATWDYV